MILLFGAFNLSYIIHTNSVARSLSVCKSRSAQQGAPQDVVNPTFKKRIASTAVRCTQSGFVAGVGMNNIG